MPSVRDQQLAKVIGTNIARKLIEQSPVLAENGVLSWLGLS